MLHRAGVAPPSRATSNSVPKNVEYYVAFGSWLCKNAETRDSDRMNILRNRIRVRKESLAHSVLLDLRKTILVASQFFAFSHSLDHKQK
jgi:hypothetical protein